MYATETTFKKKRIKLCDSEKSSFRNLKLLSHQNLLELREDRSFQRPEHLQLKNEDSELT